MSLLVTGTVAFDNLITPHGSRDGCLGGTALYCALGASLLVPVKLVAVVGEDFPDEQLKSVIGRRPIDTAGLEKRAGSKTFRWTGRYEGAMNEAVTLDTQLGVLAERGPTVPHDETFEEFVFLANSHPAVQIDLLNQLRRPKLIICDTMNLWIKTEKPTLLRLLQMVHGLVLNDGEARMLTDHNNLVKAGQTILGYGPRFVVIKKGEHGSLILMGSPENPQIAAIPAVPTANVVDPTGAGDSFAGGLCGFLAGYDIYNPSINHLAAAAIHGTCVASFTIESFSVDALQAASREKLLRRVASLRQMLELGLQSPER